MRIEVLDICNASLGKLDKELRTVISNNHSGHSTIQDKLTIFFTDKINSQLKDIHTIIQSHDAENKKVQNDHKQKLGNMSGLISRVSELEGELKRKIGEQISIMIKGELDQTKGLWVEIEALKRFRADYEKRILIISQEVETVKQLVFQLEPFKQEMYNKLSNFSLQIQ